MSLSLVVITHNEEQCIARCIESVPSADQVVVVDSGSTDSTVALARNLGAEVIHHDFEGFGRQKQWAISRADGDWILSLDADEYLSPELADEIDRIISGEAKFDGYSLPFRVLYLGRLMRFGPWSGERHLRLFLKGRADFSSDLVHEGPRLIRGNPGRVRRGCVVHESFASVAEQVNKMTAYSELWAEQQLAEGRRSGFMSICLRPAWRFISAYLIRGGFLEGTRGLSASAVSSFYVFQKWLFLWERSRRS